MPSVSISIDFGDPSGTLEEMGVEDATCAQDVINMLKESANGRGVARALEDWDLLDMGSVSVTFLPDIPKELQVQSVWVLPDKPPPWTPEVAEAHRRLQLWVKENETRAEWSDFGSRIENGE